MVIFSFRNEFDGVTVTLERDTSGPYTVEIVDDDPAIGVRDEKHSFTTLKAAWKWMLGLMMNEANAILLDGSFD